VTSPLKPRRAAAATVATLMLAPALCAAQGAPVECADLPNPVFGLGGSAQKLLVAKLGRALSNQAQPETIIYAAPGACNGIYRLVSGEAFTGPASYWAPDGTEQTCEFSAPGRSVEFAVMGNSAAACADLDALPANVRAFQGPIGSVNVFVPLASPEQSISAEAFYFVYGFGANGRAEPWTDETQIIRRDQNSFVQLYLSLASGVPATRFVGVDARNNANSVGLVAESPTPNRAIGFASGEVADGARNRVRTLAWQQAGQDCGYWPDSSVNAFDKANVRNGQHYLWGAVNLFAAVGADGVPSSPLPRKVVGLLTGEVAPPPGVNVLDLIIDNGNVPQCAMTVQRDGDLGPLSSWVPPEPCAGYFEFRTSGQTEHPACKASAACPAELPVCRHGFCEVQ
jgi:hypothetical protein